MAIGWDDPFLDNDPIDRTWITDKYGVGKIYLWGGDFYKFVGVIDSALVAGDVVCWATTTGYVTPDATSAAGTGVASQPAGIAIIACPVGKFCFIQCSGQNRVALVTDGSNADAMYIMPVTATPDGTCLGITGSGDEQTCFGFCLADDSTAAQVAGTCMLRGLV
jgi:hypothetical protein